jgi:hypothetical protein
MFEAWGRTLYRTRRLTLGITLVLGAERTRVPV